MLERMIGMDQTRVITNILKVCQEVENVKRISMRWQEGVVNNLRAQNKVTVKKEKWMSVRNEATFLG